MAKYPDVHLWQEYIKDVKPLRTKSPLHTPDMLSVPALKVLTRNFVPPITQIPPIAVSSFYNPVDTGPSSLAYNSSRRLKRPILEARPDLHGMTQAQALIALNNFIAQCCERNGRMVLVITGKGTRPDTTRAQAIPGVLRQMLPQWLAIPALNPYIDYYAPAKPQDGGEGAFYIKLRRKK